jgi:hypothetical protein
MSELLTIYLRNVLYIYVVKRWKSKGNLFDGETQIAVYIMPDSGHKKSRVVVYSSY